VKAIGGAVAVAIGAWPATAGAQAAPDLTVEIEAASDWRARGLSQSEGRAAVQVLGTWAPAESLAIEMAATTLRGSARHGGSDLGLTLAPAFSTTAAGWTWRAGATGRVFAGRESDGSGTLTYAEFNAGAARTIGPLRLALGADYAPRQAAIGGDNLYVHAMVASGLPGTAFTVHAGGGYSLGRARAGEPPGACVHKAIMATSRPA
jgi:hypothetical protein